MKGEWKELLGEVIKEAEKGLISLSYTEREGKEEVIHDTRRTI